MSTAPAGGETGRINPTGFIRENLPIRTVPGIPEIRLHAAAPSSGLHRLAGKDEEAFGTPYWAYRWAGGLALARHLLDHPQSVAGLRVLDLGAGSGLVAIAAARAGARTVLAADVDPCALAATRLNAALNRVSIATLEADLTAGAPPDVDLILVGDLFYAEELAKRVTAFLDRCLAAGRAALVGDPWRRHLPTTRLIELARYEVAEVGDRPSRASGVFAFRAGRAISPAAPDPC